MEKEFQMIKDAISDLAAKRKAWQERVRPMIMDRLRNANKVLNTQIKIDVREEISNLESIYYKVGTSKSGLSNNPVYSSKPGDIPIDVGILGFSITFYGSLLVTWRGIYIDKIVGDDDMKVMGVFDIDTLKSDDIDNLIRMFFLKIAMMYKGLDPDNLEEETN